MTIFCDLEVTKEVRVYCEFGFFRISQNIGVKGVREKPSLYLHIGREEHEKVIPLSRDKLLKLSDAIANLKTILSSEFDEPPFFPIKEEKKC